MPITTSVDFAILAPVPEEHLESGLPVCEESGFVAYGSQKWKLFEDVDGLRAEEPVPTLIYPSDQDTPDGPLYVIEWTGWYIGHVHSLGGAHPDKMKHRPESTLTYTGDNTGFWAIFSDRS